MTSHWWLKYVPKLYAIIVKLCQLMIYVSRITSGFYDWSTLEKIEVLHSENEEETISFWKKNDLFASQCTYSDSFRQAELKYIYPDQRKSFLRRVKVVIKTCPLPQTCPFRGENLPQWHVFGNGPDLFACSGFPSKRHLVTGVVFLDSL